MYGAYFGDRRRDLSLKHGPRSLKYARVGVRLFTYPKDAFRKKLVNHMQAVSFDFMVYSFVKIHKSIKTTPAMETGATDSFWRMDDNLMMSETIGR